MRLADAPIEILQLYSSRSSISSARTENSSLNEGRLLNYKQESTLGKEFPRESYVNQENDGKNHT
jgi:hypothetical protein